MRSLPLSPVALGLSLLSIGLAGCAHPRPDLKPREITERDCLFQKKQIGASPEDLVKDYLQRDAAGEFTLASNWFDSVNLCPGHEQGPDVVYVIKGSRLEKTHEKNGKASAHVTYDIVGEVEFGAKDAWHFRKRRKQQRRVFTLIHTEYGWRFRAVHLADGQYLSIATAKTRVTDPADRMALLAAGNTSSKP